MQNNEKKAPRILLPSWMKEERPLTAQFCELVNFALESDPDMSLAAFAEQLNEVNMEEARNRLQAIIEKQFQARRARAEEGSTWE